MSDKSIERATKSFVNAIVSRGGTVEGAEWCAQALDPFHDCALPNARGFPDGVGLNSVQQVIRLQMTLSKPSSIVTNGWDCHFVMFPFCSDYNALQGSLVGNFDPQNTSSGLNVNSNPLFVGEGTAAQLLGGLNAFSVPQGYDIRGSGSTIIDPPPFAAAVVTQNHLSPNPSFLTGAYRVTAQAFEVRSVGSDLYKSGSVNCWRVPSPQATANCLTQCRGFSSVGVQGANFPTSGLIMDGWPTTNDDAVLIPESRTFEAKEGCYVVSRFNNMEPDIVDFPGISPVFVWRSGYNPVSITTVNGSTRPAIGPASYTISSQVSPGAAVSNNLVNTCRYSNFDLNGAQFLGLADTDKLTVTVKWSITRFPTTRETDLIVLARPAPLRDEVALRYYAEAVHMLAVGVPVRENGLGDWFRSVVSSVAPVVSKGLEMAAPFMGAKGKAMSAAASAVSKLAAKETKKVENKVNTVVQKIDKMSKDVKKMKGKKK
jgi:hypothetical protein